ncbi:MAG TPA: BON domain-containing protein [Steroidobacteraceae bacterium]|nr:BON domain-containing protein [Steroidobacteraceae bacterium]
MRAIYASALVIILSSGVTGCALFHAREAATSGYVGDSAITAGVRTALIKDPRIKASEIEVQTSHGSVTLNGLVDSAAMKRRALEIARATPGVRTIDDRLQVAAPASSGPSAASDRE